MASTEGRVMVVERREDGWNEEEEEEDDEVWKARRLADFKFMCRAPIWMQQCNSHLTPSSNCNKAEVRRQSSIIRPNLNQHHQTHIDIYSILLHLSWPLLEGGASVPAAATSRRMSVNFLVRSLSRSFCLLKFALRGS